MFLEKHKLYFLLKPKNMWAGLIVKNMKRVMVIECKIYCIGLIGD